jgi:hypothetical protein
MKRAGWSFEQYIEEIIMLSEIIEIPGVKAKRTELISEVWEYYPQECVELGLRDQPKEVEYV